MKLKKLAAPMALILAAGVILGGCKASGELKVPEAALKTALDDSIPLLTGDNSPLLLSNVDRGFRMETYYTLGSGAAYPGSEDQGLPYLNEVLARFQEENPREIQVYIYLTDYYNKPLDDKAFQQLESYLRYISSKGLKILLRFAYDPDQPYDKSPTEEQLLSHIAQLKTWMNGHEALIRETVTAFQMGMIGAWGEWGGSQQKYNRKKIALAICDMVPEGMYLQGRYTDVTKLTTSAKNKDYVGYHNDFMVARPHPWNTAGDKNYAPRYRTFAKNAPLRLNDGEMPWVGATQEPNEYVDGKKFIQQAYEHHLATLSIEHNYKETQKKAPSPEAYNIARWKTEAITAAELKELQCPYYDSWFKDKNGKPITRTVYEYLWDFLGYQLILSNLKVTKTDGGSNVEFLITNVGLGAPLNWSNAELVVKDKDSQSVQYIALQGFDAKALTTYGQVKVTLKAEVGFDLSQCSYGVRISQKGGERGLQCLRTANNLPYEDGVNYIQKLS